MTTLVERTPADDQRTDEFHCLTCGSINTLDPVRAYNATSCLPLINIYEPLVRVRSATLGGFAPVLCVEVPDVTNGLIAGSGEVYRFPIRRGVRFHHGETLGRADVRESLLRLAHHGGTEISAMLRAALLGGTDASTEGATDDDLRDTISVRDDAVVLRLGRPFAPLLALLAARGFVQRRRDGDASSLIDARASDDANGTGPFRLGHFDRRSQTVVLERNDDYWGRRPRLQRVVIRAAPPNTYDMMRRELIEGRVDSIVADWRHVDDLEAIPGVRVIRPLPNLVSRGPLYCARVDPRSPHLLTGHLDGGGLASDFFSDIHARRAFAHAFDTERFIGETFAGNAVALRGPIPPALLPGHPVGAAYPFDLSQAATEMRRAWNGAAWDCGFRVRFGMNASSYIGRQACRILAEGLSQLGSRFAVEPVLMPQAAFDRERDQHRIPIFDFAWMADLPDAHDPARCFIAPDGFAAERTGIVSDELAAIVDAATRVIDRERRHSLYARVQEGFAALCPAVTLVSNSVMRVQRETVEGWEYVPGLAGTLFGQVWKHAEPNAEIADAESTE